MSLKIKRDRKNISILYVVFSIFTPVLFYIIIILIEKKYSDPKTFAEEYVFYLALWAIIITVVGVIISWIEPNYYDILLVRSQKDKIRLLKQFTPSNKILKLRGDNSIYDSVVKMLERALKNAERAEKVELKLLLCAPGLDYPGRISSDKEEETWGLEVYSIIEKIIVHEKTKVSITHLPDEVISGFNPLLGFLETLSNYISQKNGISSPNDIFEKLKDSSNDIVDMFLKQKKKQSNRIELNNSTIVDIPFQIFICNSENLQEVIVSFASKEILEDMYSSEPKGFHSIDPDVVGVFEEIYHTYVSEHRRMPIKPTHTLKIIEEQSLVKEHLVSNYLSSELKNGISIKVHDGVFSPKFANSSKFTSYVLCKILKGKESVLDIGSGTGIQALVALRKLEELGNTNPTIWALESVPSAFINLQENTQSTSITCRRWGLLSVLNNGKEKIIKQCHEVTDDETQIEDGVFCEFEDNSNSKFKVVSLSSEKNFTSFDLIIADLPYVDTRPSDDSELAYFDLNHIAHKTLFKAFQKNRWVSNNSILVTSFSTLGGLEDLAKFERLINRENLTAIQKFSFYEDKYLWLVYCIINSKHYKSDEYWRKRLLNS